MYDRVLFPTDGSEGAEAALEHALTLARRFDVPLHALYVVDLSAGYESDVYTARTIEALEDVGREVVDSVRERAEEAAVEVTTSVVDGTPARAIVDAAAEGDVIVMGTHGRTGLARYLVGSTTEKVVRTADVPVVAVPLAEPDDDAETESDGGQ